MSRIVVVAPLREGGREAARLLIDEGPPFDLAESGLAAHEVYLTDHEVVFVFDGVDVRSAVERLVGDPGVWKAATAWRECLSARPRLADPAYAWVSEAGS